MKLIRNSPEYEYFAYRVKRIDVSHKNYFGGTLKNYRKSSDV